MLAGHVGELALAPVRFCLFDAFARTRHEIPVDVPLADRLYSIALPDADRALVLRPLPEAEYGSYQVQVSPESFVREIAPARTFCLASEVPLLKEAGLGKGATRENTVVVGDGETELRMDHEPVRHRSA